MDFLKKLLTGSSKVSRQKPDKGFVKTLVEKVQPQRHNKEGNKNGFTQAGQNRVKAVEFHGGNV
jgi:hypothetical protein